MSSTEHFLSSLKSLLEDHVSGQRVWQKTTSLGVVGLAMGWEEGRVGTAGDLAAASVMVYRGVMETGIAPAAMLLCFLRRVNASSATRLSLPLVGMEVPEPVMEVSVARICIYSVSECVSCVCDMYAYSHTCLCARTGGSSEGCSEDISEGDREDRSEGRSTGGFNDGVIHSFHSDGSISDDSEGIDPELLRGA